MKSLLLIDANGLIHRFFHALPPLTTPEKEPVGAIYGLSSVLLKIFNPPAGGQRPDFAAAAFDRPEMTFREQVFKEYKIHRPPTANELVLQLKKSHEIFSLFGIKIFESAGFEADDIIGTLVEKFKKDPDLKIVILSGDLDVLQLVDNERAVVQFIKKGVSETILYDEKAVVERYGFLPNQLTDFKGLIGDPSDNIPGIKGIGEKTASTLLKEFKNLEEIFDNLSIIPQKISQKLKNQKKQALLSKHLATIKHDVPIKIKSVSDFEIKPSTKQEIADYFQKLGFKSLVERINNSTDFSRI
jgi:DNA polymerase-1